MISIALRPASRPFPNTGIVPPSMRKDAGSSSVPASGDVFEGMGNTGVVPPWMSASFGNTGIVPPSRTGAGNTGIVPPSRNASGNTGIVPPKTKETVAVGNTGIVPPWMRGGNEVEQGQSGAGSDNTGIVPPWIRVAIENTGIVPPSMFRDLEAAVESVFETAIQWI